MKLSSKLNRGIIVLLVLLILASLFTSLYVLKNSFGTFIKIERDKSFEQISSDLKRMAQSEPGLNPLILENYAQNEKLLIELYTNNNQLVSRYDGIGNLEKYSKKDLLEIKIDLLDQFGSAIGYLKINYIADIFSYDESISNFQKEIVRNHTLIFIISLLLGSIFVLLYSKTITDPITDIKRKTRELRKGNFNLKETNYNVFELDELSADINFLAKTLNQQEKRRIDYAHDIAHELRTPITNLLLHLEGIKDQVIEADEQTINTLLTETQRLSMMIDKLEDSFNQNNDSEEIKLENIELESLIEDITNSFIPLLKEKNINFTQVLTSKSYIETDPTKLKQILSNLISNAIKAVEYGGDITISHDKLINRDIIMIRDNGVGMDQESLSHIFDRFYRVDSARNREVGGHGLGLAITKSYADLLGYNIGVNSEPAKGSEFILTIPNKK
ncbi:sensor histidine kinase [Helcococcus massiliensis]|uniref:sensor histidine kinase n=1 Tax=Helcococcus massiliensis TaxID=2040290 RepID=UPI000CDEEBBF|nr:HAMP domain-containing sensor histidine kinase [Helcococcus massiliensis]